MGYPKLYELDDRIRRSKGDDGKKVLTGDTRIDLLSLIYLPSVRICPPCRIPEKVRKKLFIESARNRAAIWPIRAALLAVHPRWDRNRVAGIENTRLGYQLIQRGVI